MLSQYFLPKEGVASCPHAFMQETIVILSTSYFLRKYRVLSGPHACCYYKSCRRQELYVLKTLGDFLSYEKTGWRRMPSIHVLQKEGALSNPHAYSCKRHPNRYTILKKLTFPMQRRGAVMPSKILL